MHASSVSRVLRPRPASLQARIPTSLNVLATVQRRPYRKALANVQDGFGGLPEVWFTSSSPRYPPLGPVGDEGKNVDERTLKLGKTIRILQSRLPTLLNSPLPQEILSPQITLHLFPSTHPHLPRVSGRVAYLAALWTAPVAWGRVPIVGNVRLRILSERMVKSGRPHSSSASAYRSERLVVRWRTQGKSPGKGAAALRRGTGGVSEQVEKITEVLRGDATDDEEFTGLFIFEFDEEGRIVTHTIEHAEEGGSWEKTKFVTVTDWLLGVVGGKGEQSLGRGIALNYCQLAQKDDSSTAGRPQ
ncbi:MAG: hypothetical protein M1825_001457 [Sarcosagium campestre]|nr:MAG: hypothetical protein M1825_001457 [Sarcosagium campestre]